MNLNTITTAQETAELLDRNAYTVGVLLYGLESLVKNQGNPIMLGIAQARYGFETIEEAKVSIYKYLDAITEQVEAVRSALTE